ncbi:hypothetical protein LguiA_030276 [Lonicera macranthoides]
MEMALILKNRIFDSRLSITRDDMEVIRDYNICFADICGMGGVGICDALYFLI